MKTIRKVSIFKVAAIAFMAAGCLVSCNQNTQNGPTVNEMQTRLNDIMKEYQEMQSTCDDYSRQLAAKDSSIQAQAAEIQRLIDQLNNAGKGTATTRSNRTGSKTNTAKLKKLNAELSARKAEIARLQERLNQQTSELNALKAADNYADREALARLQMLVKQQENRIIALTNDKVRLTCTNDSLVAHVAYLMGQRAENENATNAEYAAQVAALQNQVANQQNEINRLREELAKQAAVASEASQKSQAPAETKTDIAKTKGSINKKLAQLQAQCDEYYEELERLRAENIILKNENDSLRSEVVSMKKNVENVAVENAKMAAKVSRASVLSTSELNVTPLKRLSNGTGKPTSRASATHAFRIEGYLMGNSVVEPGTITLYAVITSPWFRPTSSPARPVLST